MINDDEQIIAWLGGEMPPEEANRFATRLRAEPALRQQVEQTRRALEAAREWYVEEAPGSNRVEDLVIPPLAHPAARVVGPAQWRRGRSRVFSYMVRTAAAAAIFIVGFYAGHLNRATGGSPVMHVSENAHVANTNERKVPGSQQITGETPVPQQEPPPVQSARDENGHVVVETTLAGSGGRALWVVDGSFQVASNTPIQKGQ